MIAVLRIEAIGCDLPSRSRRPGDVFARLGGNRLAPMSKWLHVGRPWVARITSPRREFLRPRLDYRESRQTPEGLRGVYAYYELREGEIYEVHELLSWRESRRYRVCAENGKVKPWPRAEK